MLQHVDLLSRHARIAPEWRVFTRSLHLIAFYPTVL
jgi:hypothetical protein